MTSSPLQCLVCGETDAHVPLINVKYQNRDFWICSQHLPVLIHHPHTLAGKLPGAEGMKPAEHND